MASFKMTQGISRVPEDVFVEDGMTVTSGGLTVTVGDSIGGGIVTNITKDKVLIYKDEAELMFEFGLDKYDNN